MTAWLGSSLALVMLGLLLQTRQPDGSQWVVFSSTRSGTQDLYRVDMDGNNLQRLTNHPQREGYPRWSPSGGWIVFEAYWNRNWNIYLMRPDGSGLRQISTSPNIDRFPRWDDRGRRIIYQQNYTAISNRSIVADVRGRQLSSSTGGIHIDPVFPSPDGRWQVHLLFSQRQFRLLAVDMTTGQRHWLTTEDYSDRTITWSPDGQWIAVESNRNGNWEVYLLRPDGSAARRLTHHPADDREPSISPRYDAPLPGWLAGLAGLVFIWPGWHWLGRLDRIFAC